MATTFKINYYCIIVTFLLAVSIFFGVGKCSEADRSNQLLEQAVENIRQLNDTIRETGVVVESLEESVLEQQDYIGKSYENNENAGKIYTELEVESGESRRLIEEARKNNSEIKKRLKDILDSYNN